MIKNTSITTSGRYTINRLAVLLIETSIVLIAPIIHELVGADVNSFKGTFESLYYVVFYVIRRTYTKDHSHS